MRRWALFCIVAPALAAIALLGPQLAGHALLALGLPAPAARLLDAPAWKGAALSATGRWDDAAAAFARDPASAYNHASALARAGRIVEAIAAFDHLLAVHPDDEDAAFDKALLEKILFGEEMAQHRDVTTAPANSPASKTGGARERPDTDDHRGGTGEGLAAGRESTSRDGASGGGKAAKSGADAKETDAEARAASGAAGDAAGAGRNGDLNALVTELMRERSNRAQRRLQAGAVHPDRAWLQTLPDDPGRYLKAQIRAEKARRLKSGDALAEDD